MILFIGDVARDDRDREGFQEVDFTAMFTPLAKWAARIDNAARIPEYIARAFDTASSGRPGPVVLALPEDMLRDEVEALEIGQRLRGAVLVQIIRRCVQIGRHVRQLAGDVEQQVRRHGDRAGAFNRGGAHRFNDLQVEVGRHDANTAAVRCIDQHVRQDWYGIPPLDDALHMAERFQQTGAFGGAALETLVGESIFLSFMQPVSASAAMAVAVRISLLFMAISCGALSCLYSASVP